MEANDFYIKPGYNSRLQPAYCDDEENDGWQPEVYSLASGLLEAMDSQCVIDIGCGHGRKLDRFQNRAVILGIDYGPNIAYCKANRGRQGSFWREADLERILPGFFQAEEQEGAIIICADVIEHLRNPGQVLFCIREWMRKGKLALISTPERDLEHGTKHNGPPPNPCHVREWNNAELEEYLLTVGLNVLHVGLTRAHESHKDLRTSLAIIGPTKE